MQEYTAGRILCSFHRHGLSLGFLLALPGALAAQQLAIDFGNLFEAILQLMIILDPLSNFGHLLFGHDSSGCAASAQGNCQVPDRPVPLSFGALASRIPASNVSLEQRSAKDFSDWRQLLGQALAPLAQSQFGDST